MPKMKSRRGVMKRFKITKRGKVKRSKAGRGHILTKKSGKRKRFLRTPCLVDKANQRRISKLMPYG